MQNIKLQLNGHQLVLTILALLLGLTPLGQAEVPQLRIVNGTSAAEGQYPWMAALLPKGNNPAESSINCGGSLIAPRIVLTAAHCLDLWLPEDLEVIVGRTTLSSTSGYRVAVAAIFIPEDYRSDQLSNDLGLVFLAEDVPIEPVSLASFADPTPVIGLIMGWGTRHPNYQNLPDDLQEAFISIQDDVTCREKHGLFFKPDTMICAGELSSSPTAIDGRDTCYGDSGGPLLIEVGNGLKQVGITSWGFECASEITYGNYTDVRAYSDFIKAASDITYVTHSKLLTIQNEINSTQRSRVRSGNFFFTHSIRATVQDLRRIETYFGDILRKSSPQFTARRLNRIESLIKQLRKVESSGARLRAFRHLKVKVNRLLNTTD